MLGRGTQMDDQIQMMEADVRKAANKIESAADQVHRIGIAEHLAKVSDDLPGSRSAGAVGKTVTAWTHELNIWTKQAHGYHRSLSAAADHISREDIAVSQRAVGAHRG